MVVSVFVLPPPLLSAAIRLGLLAMYFRQAWASGGRVVGGFEKSIGPSCRPQACQLSSSILAAARGRSRSFSSSVGDPEVLPTILSQSLAWEYFELSIQLVSEAPGWPVVPAKTLETWSYRS